jgi:hypothetical protein
MKQKSKRFSPSRWTDVVVPVVLGALLLALLGTLALVISYVLGLL